MEEAPTSIGGSETTQLLDTPVSGGSPLLSNRARSFNQRIFARPEDEYRGTVVPRAAGSIDCSRSVHPAPLASEAVRRCLPGHVYFEKNPQDAYCRMHAAPKVEKVRERFADTPAR